MEVRQIFRRLSLNAKLISSYLVILGIGGLAISIVGSWIVSTAIWGEAQRTVTHDLAIARTVYEQQLDLIRRTVEASAAGITIPRHLAAGDGAALDAFLGAVRAQGDLDFLTLTDARGRVVLRAGRAGGPAPATLVGTGPPAAPDLVRAALAGGPVASTEVLAAAALAREGPALAARARLPLVATPHTEPPSSAELTSGLVMIAAAPVRDEAGRLVGALYGGTLLSRDFELVDKVWERLYRNESDEDGALGTVTVFQGDVRISTNVKTATGERALGTRVSREVRRAVLERGETWRDRAFVVDDWYISAYDPIRSHGGEAVGMLYVGLREETYAATRNRVVASFFAIATVGFCLVLVVTYWIIAGLTRPIREMVAATRSVAAGRFDHPVEVTSDGEIGLLAESFNTMQQSLREMRHDLEEAARTLEDKVEQRSEELVKMQARVAQSERLASVGMLAAGVAHEINNPLGGILALTSLTLEDLPPDDANRDNLEEVVRQTTRCADIVKHLLEFSRQHRVAADKIDVHQILEQTLSLLRRQSIFFNIEVVTALAPDLPRIYADASQLQQVFMNILLNACQAMGEKGTLTVTSRYDPERDKVELTFSDTGCGIPADKVDRIFDPFFTTKESGQGTGLGLSIAYGIVTRHHGSIAVESEVGRGTKFIVRLPANAEFQPDLRDVGLEPETARVSG
jgi:two-component system NtrC family sensor kinase